MAALALRSSGEERPAPSNGEPEALPQGAVEAARRASTSGPEILSLHRPAGNASSSPNIPPEAVRN